LNVVIIVGKGSNELAFIEAGLAEKSGELKTPHRK
jgi:hypothetical protein